MRIFNKKKEELKGWKDIKLYQLQEIETLPSYDDKLDLVVNQLSILLDKDPVDIENMPVTDLMKEFDKWRFLSDKPEEARIPVIKLDGVRYGSIDLSKMSLAQMVDIEEYVADGLMKNLHRIFSVLYLPIKSYNYITKKYTLVEYEPSTEREEAFLYGSMDVLYPQLLFFWTIVKVYLEGLASSLTQKQAEMVEKMKKEMNQEEEV